VHADFSTMDMENTALIKYYGAHPAAWVLQMGCRPYHGVASPPVASVGPTACR
jgi:hypothetical protein